jgi:4'-phosphopantetheinyl transferase
MTTFPYPIVLWHIQIHELKHLARVGRSLLSKSELERAETFRHERDRDAFISRRYLLRLIVSVSTGLPAAAIEFSHGPFGKPACSSDGLAINPAFNLSHCRDTVLVAIGFSPDLGVDILARSVTLSALDLVSRILSPAEQTEWQLLPWKERESTIRRAWVRKEALLKGAGVGLQIEPNQIHVGLANRGSSWRIRDVPHPLRPKKFTLIDVAAPQESQAAVCVAGDGDLIQTGPDWKLEILSDEISGYADCHTLSFNWFAADKSTTGQPTEGESRQTATIAN